MATWTCDGTHGYTLGSPQEVQHLFDSHAADGDTISIPAGAYTWSSSVSFGSRTSRTKMVKLTGAGPSATTGTRITLQAGMFTAWLHRTLAAFELYNLRLINGTGDDSDFWVGTLRGNADTYASLFQIHHVYFEFNHSYGNALGAGGLGSYYYSYDKQHPYIYGLVDHVTTHGTHSYQFFDIQPFYDYWADGDSEATFGGAPTYTWTGGHYTYKGIDAWKVDLADHWNSWKAVYVEDSVFEADDWESGHALLDGKGGTVYVARHNFYKNVWNTNHGYEDDYRGGKWMEHSNCIYTIDTTADEEFSAINFRSGSGVVYSNQLYDANRRGTFAYTTGGCFNTGVSQTSVSGGATGVWDYFATSEYYRAFGGGKTGPLPWCPAVTAHTDSYKGCDNADDYICGDMVGAKKGPADATYLFGYKWSSEPVYVWSNYHNALVTMENYGDGAYVQIGRDIINNGTTAKPGYTAYTYPHPLAGGGSPTGTITLSVR